MSLTNEPSQHFSAPGISRVQLTTGGGSLFIASDVPETEPIMVGDQPGEIHFHRPHILIEPSTNSSRAGGGSIVYPVSTQGNAERLYFDPDARGDQYDEPRVLQANLDCRLVPFKDILAVTGPPLELNAFIALDRESGGERRPRIGFAEGGKMNPPSWCPSKERRLVEQYLVRQVASAELARPARLQELLRGESYSGIICDSLTSARDVIQGAVDWGLPYFAEVGLADIGMWDSVARDSDGSVLSQMGAALFARDRSRYAEEVPDVMLDEAGILKVLHRGGAYRCQIPIKAGILEYQLSAAGNHFLVVFKADFEREFAARSQCRSALSAAWVDFSVCRIRPELPVAVVNLSATLDRLLKQTDVKVQVLQQPHYVEPGKSSRAVECLVLSANLPMRLRLICEAYTDISELPMVGETYLKYNAPYFRDRPGDVHLLLRLSPLDPHLAYPGSPLYDAILGLRERAAAILAEQGHTG